MTKNKKNTEQEDLENENTDNSPEVEQELSQVATNPKQNVIIIVAIAAVCLYLFFNFVINSDQEKKETVNIPDQVITPTQKTEIDTPNIPSLPTPPALEDLPPPPPPPPAISGEDLTSPTKPEEDLPALPINTDLPTQPVAPVDLPFTKVEDDKAKKRQEKKQKSTLVAISGVPQTKTAEELQQDLDFKYRGDMSLILNRGKIIDAIVESAINTDFGGEVRALVNKDVYSELGKNILIPKGSRIFGNYSTSIDGPYAYVNVIWTRIDMANGFSVNIQSNTVDSLGKTGHQGRIDNKFKERLGNAVLRSAFNISLANVLDELVPPVIDSDTGDQKKVEANNITTIATSIYVDPTLNNYQKIVQICAQTQAAISDKSSSAYLQLQSSCTTLINTPTGASNVAELNSLMNTVNSVSASLIEDATSESEETQAQKASKQAFEDISETLKSFVEEQNIKPTITIDQGTLLKIYVNKDYVFPKKAVSKMRVY